MSKPKDLPKKVRKSSDAIDDTVKKVNESKAEAALLSSIEKPFFGSSPIKENEVVEESESIPQTIQKEEDIPVVVESPTRSPILQLPSSSTASNTLFHEKNRRNVCSFLSDIESEGYLSSFSLLNDLESEDDEGAECAENTNKFSSVSKETSEILSSTTVEQNSQNVDLSSSDDDEDDTTSSSETSSSDDDSLSSSSEEESSDTSSNEDLTHLSSSGFGRFSSSESILPFNVPFTTKTITQTTTTTDMQTKSLENSIIKPPLFTAAPCIRPSQIALKSGTLIPSNFAVPFKIYSIRDFSTAQFSQPIFSTPLQSQVTLPQAKASPKETKPDEKEVKSDKDHGFKDEKRSRKSRSRSFERRRSAEREQRNRKNDRRRSPPSVSRKRSISPPHIARRRSLTPSVSQKSRSSRHSPPPGSRYLFRVFM